MSLFFLPLRVLRGSTPFYFSPLAELPVEVALTLVMSLQGIWSTERLVADTAMRLFLVLDVICLCGSERATLPLRRAAPSLEMLW